jgi:hypothetical protein
MSDGLDALLRRLDHSGRAIVTFDETTLWSEGERDRLLKAGLLMPAEPTHRLVCDECGEWEDVELLESVTSPPFAAVLCCPVTGSYPVAVERLQSWQLTVNMLMGHVARLLGVEGKCEPVARDCLWRLGKLRCCATTWTVYFGRGLHRSEAWQIIHKASLPLRSVVFVPVRRPAADSRVTTLPPVIALTEVLSFVSDQPHCDREAVEQLLAAQATSCPPPLTARRKGSRPGVIAALRRELKEHVQAARDHAEETLETTGTARLLCRPTMKDLARRVGVDKSTVSRCFEDPSADDLRYMWELAADVDRLLSRAGCRV